MIGYKIIREAIREGRECEICGDVATTADHCHKEKKWRGPLCGMCNSGLGFFRDSPDLMRAAANYIEEYIALFIEEDAQDIRTDKALKESGISPF